MTQPEETKLLIENLDLKHQLMLRENVIKALMEKNMRLTQLLAEYDQDKLENYFKTNAYEQEIWQS